MIESIKELFSKYGGRFSAVWGLVLFWLIVDFFVRLGLTIYSANQVSFSVWTLIKMFVVGFFFDLSVALHGMIPLVLYLAIVPRKWFDRSWNRWIIRGFIWLGASLILFGAVSEYFFWEEFQSRFNFIAVDYLVYTTEVLKNIRESYPVFTLIGVIGFVAAGVTWLLDRYLLVWKTEANWKKRAGTVLLFILFPFVSFFGMNGNYKNISDNMYNDELAGNGLYELFSAFRNNELDYHRFYRTLPDAEAEALLRAQLEKSGGTMISSEPWNLTRKLEGKGALKQPNIIFITVESLSSDYLGIYGNQEKLTPRLDALSKESLWFSKVYATGTRTVRGLEAITLAIPPTPGQSIVRRLDNQDLFTIGSVLNNQGYESHFLYGGYGYFDNMNEFFSVNGYSITDRSDIPKEKIVMENAWGVADEVIFSQALENMDQDYAQGKRSFQMIMTTSNHRPFTYPDGRIDIPSPGDREGAVKYTDWAIGNFIDQAKTKPWFKDTIFIIMADHQADSAGKTEVPIQRYHIPVLVYGPEWIKPGKVDRLMSQIDIAPTILGLLNFSYESRFLGYDLNQVPEGEERIFISTYQSIAYAKGDKLVVLNPKQRVTTYQINYETGEYQTIAEEPALVREAIAWYQGASKLYKTGGYQAIH